MKLIIEDDEGRKTVVPVVREEITIGRQDGNTIKLTERNVSRRHARLVKDNGSLLIEDLGSYNGVRVNGDRISSPTAVKEGDLIEIGDYDLGIQGKFEAAATPTGQNAAAAKAAGAARATVPPMARPTPAPAAAAPAPAPEPMPAPAPSAGPAMTPMGGAAAGATAIIRVSDIMKSAGVVEVRELAKNEMPRLVGLAGAYRGKELYLMRSEVKIGRTDENDIGIDHQSISRQHCRFALEETGWKVYDNKSANGVKVNGDEYAVSAVKPGDTIELGHVKFRFCDPGEKFSAPPEKGDGALGAGPGGGKALPSTAELLAGAQARDRGTGASSSAPAGKKSKLGMMIGIGAAVVVLIGVVAVVMMKRGADGDDAGDGKGPSGEAAVKAAQAAVNKKDFKKAAELIENAGDKAPASLKKKIAEESGGQETYEKMSAALDAGNGDVAKAAFEKCAATDNLFYCGKAKEKEDAVKQAFAKKHNAAGSAAAKAGNSAQCSTEVGLVLAFDPTNAEAQAISAQCSPQAAPPPKEVPKGPSQREKDQMADKLANEAIAKAQAKDYAGAMDKFKQALDKGPKDRDVLRKIYKNYGISSVFAGDKPSVVKYFKLYLPMAEEGEKARLQALITQNGG